MPMNDYLVLSVARFLDDEGDAQVASQLSMVEEEPIPQCQLSAMQKHLEKIMDDFDLGINDIWQQTRENELHIRSQTISPLPPHVENARVSGDPAQIERALKNELANFKDQVDWFRDNIEKPWSPLFKTDENVMTLTAIFTHKPMGNLVCSKMKAQPSSTASGLQHPCRSNGDKTPLGTPNNDTRISDFIRSTRLSNKKKATPKMIKEGKELLSQILASIESTNPPIDEQAENAIEILRANAIFGAPVCVLIYRKGSDWWADVVFDDEETGRLDRLGIAAASPASSRDQAIEYAETMLRGWAHAKKAPPANSDNIIMIGGKRVKVMMC